MGNELEAVEVWHVESACIPANFYPSIGAYFNKEWAEESAAERRLEASTWAAVRVTGPHTFYRPKKGAIKYGPRHGIPADLGCEAL
jgi:hypothetical protein